MCTRVGQEENTSKEPSQIDCYTVPISLGSLIADKCYLPPLSVVSVAATIHSLLLVVQLVSSPQIKQLVHITRY